MKKWMIGFVTMLAVVTGCRQREPQGTMALEEQQAVYYWRTDLRLDSTERAFLTAYHVKKVYCRYFDVVMKDEGPMPNATLTFSDTLPSSVEVVPTVYITEDCMHERHEGLAKKLVEHIRQMNETNDISGVREIQIDCDFTANSRQVYYEFLKEVVSEWSKVEGQRSKDEGQRSKDEGQRSKVSPLTPHLSPLVSTTIRLHQLSMPVPPVDYGVLMIYNTGDPRKFMERNPILDMRDVAPYLSRLKGYQLPLAAAYPVYSWQRTIHGVHVEHTVEADEILKVKKAVESRRPDLSRTIITYHLDQTNINRYKPETYEAMYHH